MVCFLKSKFEACGQLVVNEDGRFPAGSKDSHDPVVVHREEMNLMSLVHSFCINRVGKGSGFIRHDDAIIDGDGDRVCDGRFASGNIPLCLGIPRLIRRKLRRSAAGERCEAADGEQSEENCISFHSKGPL